MKLQMLVSAILKAEILKMKCQMFCMIVHYSNKITQNFFSVGIYKVTKI